MKDARSWIARLGMAGLCLTGIGCGGGGLPDPSSDPSAVQEAPPPPTAGAAPSAAPAPAAPAREAAPQLARNDAAPAPAPAPAEPAAAATVEPTDPAPAAAPAANETVAVATSPAPADGSAPAGEEKPAAAAKGDASGTSELLNLSNNATNTAPAAEAPKEGATAGPGATPGPGSMPGAGSFAGPGGTPRDAREGMPAMPGAQPGSMPGSGGGFGSGSGMGDGMGDANANAPANYSMPLTGAYTFLNAVKSKNKDRIADATALHAPKEAHNAPMQKLFSQIVDLSVSDEQVADLAKALDGYRVTGLDTATSSGRQKVVLGKPNGQNGQFRRTITMRREAKGWKVVDISGQSEIQGFRGIPMRPGRRR